MYCGMPPLHSRNEIIKEANLANFVLIKYINLEEIIGKPFYYCFSNSKIFMWMMESLLIKHLINIAQFLHILPPGFNRFNKIFLFGTVNKIVKAGKLGILSGSEILLFKKIR
ncbi:SAM_MT_ERG6_SMT domain-containing protein [Meloidogyne graminicola]|uniref:SAM_MT_ERG6_SMT domain-containing protein n=1 Tax=Meloidogyne graminicola TaxID=189291 RepID=A0A8S9ZS03_9BILA|nr:SAM_MT_ERG6_SMT domain-containing protein [Meloidogyne graminicola]